MNGVKKGTPGGIRSGSMFLSSQRLIVLLSSCANLSEPPLPDSCFAFGGYSHAAFPYLCLSSSALLDSSAGQGGGGHKTGEES